MAEIITLQTQAMDVLQVAIAEWVRTRFGDDAMNLLIERAARVEEEATELGQACGMTREQAHAIVDMVYSRPSGEIAQEIAGTGVTLLALAESQGISFHGVVVQEVNRIHAKPVDHFRERQREKRELLGFGIEVPRG